ERRLGHQLVSFTINRLVAMLKANGSLLPTAAGLGAADPRLVGHAAHLAMEEPSREAISALASEVVRFLTGNGQIKPRANPLELEPNVLERALWSTHAALGGERPTLLGRLQDEVRDHYRSLWRQYIRRLNTELLERAPGLYTRLVLEMLLKGAVILDQ